GSAVRCFHRAEKPSLGSLLPSTRRGAPSLAALRPALLGGGGQTLGSSVAATLPTSSSASAEANASLEWRARIAQRRADVRRVRRLWRVWADCSRADLPSALAVLVSALVVFAAARPRSGIRRVLGFPAFAP